ncbi:hypothetical protein BH11PSE5_BH11PSE5_20870 [soil metagenome]
MSKTLRTVAIIAGAVALVATGVGAAAGAGLIGTAGATAGAATVAGISASTLATVGAIASVASTLASVAAQVTAKKPPARGSVNQVLIASDALAPYLIGRTFFGGVLRHDKGYGATLKKVPNPYRAMVLVYSVCGPLQGLEAPYMDFAPVTINSGGEAAGYYNGFLHFDYRVGNDPDSALVPHYAGLPGWSSAHKLSSKACALWNLKFDKDGKRFASGVPSLGAIWRGVRVYDPRLDSTYPGGSGPQRIDNEATWSFAGNECPGLNGLAYALGRYRNGKKVYGVGLPPAGVMIEHFVTLANICDANGWKVGGVIFEPGDRWANLKDILQAGGAEPGFIGGKLGLKINAPRVSLDTITAVDLADDDAETTAMQSWRNRLNGIVPKFRSEAHKWEYVPSDLVTIPAYVTEDGEEKTQELQWNLVQQKNQVAQLAAYELVNGRELSPIVLVCKPRLRKYGMGDMLTINLPGDHGLANVDAVIIDRSVDPETMKVTLTFMSETAGKHDFALGRTGTAPPTPSLTSPNDRDDVITAVDAPRYDDGTFIDDLRPAEPGATNGMSPSQEIVFDQLTADTAAALQAIADAEAQITDILSDVSTLEGSIATQDAVIVSLGSTVSSNGASISSLQTITTSQGGQIASLSSSLTTANANISSNASAISGIGSSVSSLSSTVASQGATIGTLQTTASTLAGDVAQIRTELHAGNPNLINNGSGEIGLTNWSSGFGSWDVTNTNLWGSYFYVASSGASGDKFYHLRHNPVPFNEGYRATFAAGIDFHSSAGGFAYLEIRFFNSSGTVIGQYEGAASSNHVAFGDEATTRSQLKCTTDVAAPGTVSAQATVVFFTPNGVNLIGGAFRQAKLEQGAVATPYSSEASILQTFSALSTLNSQYSSITTTVAVQGVTVSQNQVAIGTLNGQVATLFGRWSAVIDVGGYVSSLEANNNGSTASWKFRTDELVIEDAGNPASGFRFANGRIRVSAGGGFMKVMGDGFGSANQFIEWYGPFFSDVANCTETNAISYAKTNGEAYFGGGLSSGVLKNEGTSTTISETASIVVGPFSSNGDPININFSASYSFEQEANSSTASISGSGGATLTLEYETSGGWNFLTSIAVNEVQRQVIVDGEPGIRDKMRWRMAAGGTFTWTFGAVSGLRLRARWSGFSIPSFLGSGLGDQNIAQQTSIIAVEV